MSFLLNVLFDICETFAVSGRDSGRQTKRARDAVAGLPLFVCLPEPLVMKGETFKRTKNKLIVWVCHNQ